MIKAHIKTADFECIDFDYKTIDEFKANYAEDCLIARKEHYNQALAWKKANEAKSPK